STRIVVVVGALATTRKRTGVATGGAPATAGPVTLISTRPGSGGGGAPGARRGADWPPTALSTVGSYDSSNVALAPCLPARMVSLRRTSWRVAAGDGPLSAGSALSPAAAAPGAGGFGAVVGAAATPGAIASAPGPVAASRSGGVPGFASVPEWNSAATVSGRT